MIFPICNKHISKNQRSENKEKSFIGSATGLEGLKYLYIPIVNFIHIIRAAFSLIFFRQKITKPNSN